MSTWKVILATLVIFTAGLFTGNSLLWKFGPKSTAPGYHRPREGPPFPWQLREEYVRRLSRDLDLIPSQTEKIVRIITDSQVVMSNLFSQIGPQMREEMGKVNDRIRSVLTPDQQTRFEEMRKRRRFRQSGGPPEKRRFRPGGGPPEDRRSRPHDPPSSPVPEPPPSSDR